MVSPTEAICNLVAPRYITQSYHRLTNSVQSESQNGDHLGVGELDGILEVIIFAEGKLLVVKFCNPARLDAAATPCH